MNTATMKCFCVVVASVAGVGIASYAYVAYKNKKKTQGSDEKGVGKENQGVLVGVFDDGLEGSDPPVEFHDDVRIMNSNLEIRKNEKINIKEDLKNNSEIKNKKINDNKKATNNEKLGLNSEETPSNATYSLKTSENTLKQTDDVVNDEKDLQNELLTALEKQKLNLNLLTRDSNNNNLSSQDIIISPLDFNDNDSLEDTNLISNVIDEIPIKLETTVNSDDIDETPVKLETSAKCLSEENIDAGLGDSLLEDNAEGNEVQSAFRSDTRCSDVGNVPVKDGRKNKFFISFEKNHLNKKSQKKNDIYENKMSALFRDNKESSKFKSKIPHVYIKTPSKTPVKTDFMVKKSLKKENISKPSNLNRTKSGLKQPTTIPKSFSVSKNPLQTSMRPSIKKNNFGSSDLLHKHNINDKKTNILNKKFLVHKPFSSAYDFKTSSSLSKSQSTNTSVSNLDDSLEDLSVTNKDLADSLEDVSGILDEEPCLVDDDDDEGGDDEGGDDGGGDKESGGDEGGETEARGCSMESTRRRMSRDSFESSSPKEMLSEIAAGEVDEFDSREMEGFVDERLFSTRPDFDQSYFMEQNENELLFNIAMEEDNVDLFISFLRRSSISKQQKLQCWKGLERLSSNHQQSTSFHSHLFFIFSFFNASFHKEVTSPFKILLNLSRNQDSILFILSSQVSETILNLFRPETSEEILFLWLPLVINIMIYIKKNNLNSHIMSNFYQQYYSNHEKLKQNSQHKSGKTTFHHEKHFLNLSSPTANNHVATMEGTLYHVFFGPAHKQEIMENIEKLTTHSNKHIITLSKALHLSFQHMK